MVKGLRHVVVPDVGLLAPDALSAILRSAGVPYTDFLDYLSETPTEPAFDPGTGTRRIVALSTVPPSEDAAAS